MRDPRKKKLRDLRRIARSRGYNPSIYDLFDKYHPEIKARDDDARTEYRGHRFWYCLSAEWHTYYDLRNEWVIKIAGYWNAVGGAPPAWFRRTYNRKHRTRQKAALNKAFREDAWDDFLMPKERCNLRWEWW